MENKIYQYDAKKFQQQSMVSHFDHQYVQRINSFVHARWCLLIFQEKCRQEYEVNLVHNPIQYSCHYNLLYP